MADSLEKVAPAFIEMAHRIVWATVATVDTAGKPSTRVLHPVWQWDGSAITGWIATSPLSPKAKHLERVPQISVTYWHPDHDTCTAECTASWELSPEQRRDGWQRFVDAPAPVGYDPSIIPAWKSPESEAFGILRVDPISLRVLRPANGGLLRWRAS